MRCFATPRADSWKEARGFQRFHWPINSHDEMFPHPSVQPFGSRPARAVNAPSLCRSVAWWVIPPQIATPCSQHQRWASARVFLNGGSPGLYPLAYPLRILLGSGFENVRLQAVAATSVAAWRGGGKGRKGSKCKRGTRERRWFRLRIFFLP